jgi:hypothetical protein
MKTYRVTRGPFGEQPYYEKEDIEGICSGELRKVGLLPSQPEPIRIERFIEKRFRAHPIYEELPPGVLGFTVFDQNGVKEVVISRDLVETNDKVAERRVNTTLAHEAGHALLHAHLFAFEHQPSLFGNDPDMLGPKILCREEAVQGTRAYKQNRYNGKWWEHQANLTIGSLLLPCSLVQIALNSLLIERGDIGSKVLIPERREEAKRMLVELFEVNLVVAKIRMDDLFPAGQLVL